MTLRKRAPNAESKRFAKSLGDDTHETRRVSFSDARASCGASTLERAGSFRVAFFSISCDWDG